MQEILNFLLQNQDLKYRDFSTKISVAKEELIGVRMPILKSYAKQIAVTSLAKQFLEELPHEFCEENLLHALIICNIKESMQNKLNRIRTFLPYVNGWAVCDCLASNCKALKKDLGATFNFACECCNSMHLFTKRFGLVVALCYLVNTPYEEECTRIALKLNNQLSASTNAKDEYYLKMALAWYFSVVAINNYAKVQHLLQTHALHPNVHKLTIQKICDSYRIPNENKIALKVFKN